MEFARRFPGWQILLALCDQTDIVIRTMDELGLIEIIEAVRHRLHEEMSDLDARLERIVLADYRAATPGLLQECLTQVVYGLDSRSPNEAREIQRKIALAEAVAPAATLNGREKAPSWVIRENGSINEEQDPKFNQGIRYLSLPAADEASEICEPDVTAIKSDRIPSRLGRELSRCVSVRQAVACIKKRLPNLKTIPAYRFLAAIGYPVAVPTSDAIRFCGYVGLLSSEDTSAAGAAEKFIAICERAARLTATPVAHIGQMFLLYATGSDDAKPICGKRPRCQVCALTSRCSQYAATGKTVDSEGSGRGRPINEWAVDERPRERLLAGERLSNSELLAIILRTGSGRLSAVELARELMNEFQTLHDLEKASPRDIVERMRGKGIGQAKAAEICAAIELGRRVAQPAADTRLGQRQVAGSRDIFELCRPRYKSAMQEEFLLLILNTKNRVQKEVPISLGTLNSSIVHPRDVFRHALREAAAAVIFVHNHPSGDPAPSEEDILLTARLVDVGKLLGIQVLDHVIIGSHEWYSFADHGRMK